MRNALKLGKVRGRELGFVTSPNSSWSDKFKVFFWGQSCLKKDERFWREKIVLDLHGKDTTLFLAVFLVKGLSETARDPGERVLEPVWCFSDVWP